MANGIKVNTEFLDNISKNGGTFNPYGNTASANMSVAPTVTTTTQKTATTPTVNNIARVVPGTTGTRIPNYTNLASSIANPTNQPSLSEIKQMYENSLVPDPNKGMYPIATGTVPTTTDNNGGGGSGSGGAAAGIYQSYLDQLLADQKAASDARQRALEENYNRALGVLRDNHNSEVSKLNTNADDALRQAYINYMKGQRNLGQNLANLGINGGATESVLANIFNTYGNNRNAIETERQNALGDLASRYNESVADLSESYGNNLASVLEDYYNNAANTKSTYANKIATALGTGSGSGSKSSGSGSTSAEEKKATARYQAVMSAINANKGNPKTLLKYLETIQDYTPEQLNTMLLESGIDPEELYNAVYPSTVPVTGNNNSNNTSASTGSRYVIPVSSGGSRSR